MITTDRDKFVGFHLTNQNKEHLREEAARRDISMSLLLSNIIEDWLALAPDEQVEPQPVNKEEDVPLPFEGAQS